MHIPVLIEPAAGGGYVARAGSPFDWSAEGATQDEALQKLQAVVAAKVAAGARVAAVEAAPADDPLAQLRAKGRSVALRRPSAAEMGRHWDPNDPLIGEWKKAVEECCQQVDNDQNVYQLAEAVILRKIDLSHRDTPAIRHVSESPLIRHCILEHLKSSKAAHLRNCRKVQACFRSGGVLALHIDRRDTDGSIRPTFHNDVELGYFGLTTYRRVIGH